MKSPVFASVTAARPICRPVRREVIGHFGDAVQNLIHVVENTVGFGQRCSRRGEVIQYKCALIHLRQQVGAEAAITEVARDDEHRTYHHQGKRALKRPLQRALVVLEQTVEGGSTFSFDTSKKATSLFFFAYCGLRRESSSPAGERAPE